MKIGIIGLGRMGKNHLRVLNHLRSSVDDISIYDTDIKTMIEMSKIYDVKHYEDLDSFLDNVNAVIICTPTTTHYELAKSV
ncbi:Gfo/Idh/MocA family oxidoreductase [Clostridium sp. OS1-26]|nr:Gfo/Idh/MocA family oxidoreductase [Clostridium sp. OS1-26]WML35863.1 Gfo/Idh/MocA family oxidoreductase [Clostridium sp. OS1-26]